MLWTILIYCWFFSTPRRGGWVFLSWHLSFFCLYCWLYKIIWKDYIKDSLNISALLPMKIILEDTNLVRVFLVLIFLILIMVRTLENNYFLMDSKLRYLQYTHWEFCSTGITVLYVQTFLCYKLCALRVFVY